MYLATVPPVKGTRKIPHLPVVVLSITTEFQETVVIDFKFYNGETSST